MNILTLDLGTTYFKAALFDEGGRLLHVAHEALAIDKPKPGWWELPGDSFEVHVRAVLGKLRALAGEGTDGFGGVGAMSFATQANSVRLYVNDDVIFSPMVLWLDERAEDYRDALTALVSRMDHQGLTGIPEISHQFLLARLLYWSRVNEGWGQVRDGGKICLISDVLTRWFTGEHVTEAGVAGLSGMVDIHQLDWIDELIDEVKLDRSCFGKIVRAGTDVGCIRAAVADEFGLPRTCRFVVGCLDQYAGAIGAGNVGVGKISETTGTVLATVRCTDKFDPSLGKTGVYQGPAFEAGRYFQMAFSTASASLLERYRREHAAEYSFEQLGELASTVSDKADDGAGIVLNASASASAMQAIFTGELPSGLTDEQRIAREVYAIFDGVAGELNRQIGILCGDDRPESVRCVGGAARSDVWRAIKAQRVGARMLRVDCEEPTSLGAAICAASAVQGRTIPEVAKQWVRVVGG